VRLSNQLDMSLNRTFWLVLRGVFFMLASSGLLVGGLLAGGPSAGAADLLEVYREAQTKDPSFEAARYAFVAMQEKIPQARAGFLPVVNLTGSDSDNKALTKFTNAPTVYREVNTWSLTLQLTQPLFRAQNIYAYSETESLVEQARAQFILAEQTLILRVTQAYFDILVVQESMEVADIQLKAAEEQLALAKGGFEAGANAITDVHEGRSRADLARSQRIATANELEAKYTELEKVIGREIKTLSSLKPLVVLPRPQPENVRAWIDQARENNPAVLAPKAALGAAEAAVNKNRAEYAPTLDLVASHGRNYSSGSVSTPSDYGTNTHSTQLGIQFTVPLFAGGGTHSRVTEAIANVGKAVAEVEVARRQAGADARQAYSAIVNGMAQIEALESAVESSTSSVKGNKVGYKLGIRMNIDVLNAEQQLYTAQRDLVKARYDTLLQGFKLKAAAGGLSEEDVYAVNQLLLH
jgi:outer membrane protein